MLSVRSKPILDADPQFGWQFTLQLGDAFDYGIPFREALAEIVEVLGGPETAVLNLPPHSADEDFVQGTLLTGDATLGVYYEYSLGYLSLMSGSRSVLEKISSRLSRSIQVR